MKWNLLAGVLLVTIGLARVITGNNEFALYFFVIGLLNIAVYGKYEMA